jgi:hypothetical protein
MTYPLSRGNGDVADEIHQFIGTIPAGTPKSALYTATIPLANFEIESIDVEVPPGPAYLMGFYIARSGQQVIPWEAGSFIVWDNHKQNWPLSNQPTGQGWQIVGYNLGKYPHTVTLRFHVVASLDSPAIQSVPSITIVTQPLAGSTSIL